MEKGSQSVPVVLNSVEFGKAYKEAGETTLIDFLVGDADYKVLISEVQLHPVTLKPIHAAFRKVNLKEKITAQVSVEVINEELNALVKTKEAVVLKLLDEIEVEALPTDLPREFVVDASKLAAVGDEIKVKDLDYDRAKVEITNHSDEDPVVLLDKIEEIKEEEAPVSEEEALAKVTATEELSEEEKAKRALEKEEKPEKVKK
ncbi:MAG: 50S ribosomal protein L25 [candidate division WWE3 bacterium GW2011_GWB1_44_4]|nr:MAG: 50S ribosomal protein L25 [candidate division WWE3 bacterium GW2011_GWB1_44_4]